MERSEVPYMKMFEDEDERKEKKKKEKEMKEQWRIIGSGFEMGGCLEV